MNKFKRHLLFFLFAAGILYMILMSYGRKPSYALSTGAAVWKPLLWAAGFFALLILCGYLLSSRNKKFNSQMRAMMFEYLEGWDIEKFIADTETFINEIQEKKISEKKKTSLTDTLLFNAGTTVFYYAGDFERALRLFNRIDFHQLTAMLQYNYCFYMAMIKAELSFFEQAVQWAERMRLIQKKDEPLSKFAEAYTFYQSGDLEKCRQLYQSIEKDQRMLDRIDFIYLGGLMDEAEGHIEKAAEKFALVIEYHDHSYMERKALALHAKLSKTTADAERGDV